jgi:hypothetical protein
MYSLFSYSQIFLPFFLHRGEKKSFDKPKIPSEEPCDTVFFARPGRRTNEIIPIFTRPERRTNEIIPVFTRPEH